MTKEEAWEELKETIVELRDNDGVSTQQEICKFLANFMNVLEKQIRCDDCYYKALEQEFQWIPTSERLPEEDGEYLLWGQIGEEENEENYIFIGEYDSCGEQFGIWQEQFDIGNEFFEYSSVIAWQPLPQPYEESEV